MQQEEIEFVRATAGQFLLRRHAEVARVVRREAQAGIGEAREALRAVALAGVKVVPDCAGEAIAVAPHAGQGAAEHLVRRAVAVHVGGQKGADALLMRVLDGAEKTVVVERFAKVHEASAAPGAVGRACRFHKMRVNRCVSRAGTPAPAR